MQNFFNAVAVELLWFAIAFVKLPEGNSSQKDATMPVIYHRRSTGPSSSGYLITDDWWSCSLSTLLWAHPFGHTRKYIDPVYGLVTWEESCYPDMLTSMISLMAQDPIFDRKLKKHSWYAWPLRLGSLLQPNFVGQVPRIALPAHSPSPMESQPRPPDDG